MKGKMKKAGLFIIGGILILFSCTLPKENTANFEGKFVYHIDNPMNTQDKSDSINYQIVYATDSMLRIDNYTPIGKQIFIKHIPLNRAYILMDLGNQKVAIQTIPDTAEVNNSYAFKHRSGTKTIGGVKTKNIEVKDLELDTTLLMNYAPDIPSKYSTSIVCMPGTPIRYYLFTDNVWLTYELISLDKSPLHIDLFGIPSDYQIVTLDEFIEMIEGE